MRRHSWERISQLFKVSSRILKISRWSRCSMSPAQLVNNQEEIHGLDKINWGKNSWKRPVTDWWWNSYQTKLGRPELEESNPGKATEIMMLSMESRLNSSGTSSQDSQRCSLAVKSQIYWATWDKHQKLSQEEFSLCRCSTTLPGDSKGNEEECVAKSKVVSILAKNLVFG